MCRNVRFEPIRVRPDRRLRRAPPHSPARAFHIAKAASARPGAGAAPALGSMIDAGRQRRDRQPPALCRREPPEQPLDRGPARIASVRPTRMANARRHAHGLERRQHVVRDRYQWPLNPSDPSNAMRPAPRKASRVAVNGGTAPEGQHERRTGKEFPLRHALGHGDRSVPTHCGGSAAGSRWAGR